MRLARLIVAGAFVFGVGCMMPEDGEQGVDLASQDDSIIDESEAAIYEDQAADDAIDETMALTSDSSAAAMEGDEGLLGEKDTWVCWFCSKAKEHDGQGLEGEDKCPKEYCYHGKDKKKNKAKKEAEDECQDEHEHCYFKDCKKFD
jgi:hypothetical protein